MTGGADPRDEDEAGPRDEDEADPKDDPPSAAPDDSGSDGSTSRIPDMAALLSEDTAYRRFLQYALVGVVGLAINEGVLFLVTGVAGLSYVIGGFLGRVISILANYAINDVWTWSGRGGTGARRWIVRGSKYVVTRIVGIAIGLAALIFFVEVLAVHYLVANVLAVGVGAAWGFGISERWVWPDQSTESLGDWARRRFRQVSGVIRRTFGLRRPRRSADDRTAPSRPDGGSQSDVDESIRSDGEDSSSTVRSRIEERTRSVRTRIGDSTRTVRTRVGAIRRRQRERTPREGLAAAGEAVYDRLTAVDRRTWLVVALAAALAVWFVWYQIQLYRAYDLTGADFGSYVHMMWTTVNGEGFLQQGKFRVNHPGGVYWGAHAALTILFVLPIYALLPSPITLIVLKALLIAASIVMLWLLAREWTGHDWIGGLAVASYAFNPFLWSAWSFDFQEQAMLPLFVFTALYMYARDRNLLFLLFLLLALFTNEFMIPVVGGFVVGLAIAAYRADELDDRWPTVVGALACVVLAHVVSGLVVGMFSRYGGLPTREVAVPFQQFLDHPRTSTFAVAQAALQHPNLAIDVLMTDFERKLVYFFALFLPVGFLSLTDELTIPAMIPFLGFAWVLGHKTAYYVFAAHYPLYFLPFVYVGMIHTLDRASLPTISTDWVVRLLVLVMLLNVGTFLLVGAGNMKPVPERTEHHAVLDEAVESIPDDATLLTQNNVFPHAAERPEAHFMVSPYEIDQYQEEFGPVRPDYVLVDMKQQAFWARTVMGAFGDRLHTEYGVYKYEDGVWIFRRGYSGQATTITDDRPLSVFEGERKRYEAEEFTLKHGERRGDYIFGDGETEGIIWYGPYEIVPPGEYTAFFRVNATGPGNVGNVHVMVGERHEVIGTRELNSTDGWYNVAVKFTLDRPTAKVELRGVHYGGEGEIAMKWASIVRSEVVEDRIDEQGPAGGEIDEQAGAADRSTAPARYSSVTSSPDPAEPLGRSVLAARPATVAADEPTTVAAGEPTNVATAGSTGVTG